MNVQSPITKRDRVKLEREISCASIIHAYRRDMDMDVSRYFQGAESIRLYRCLDSGYRFYYPYISGDSELYGALAKYGWYYMPWKWEHEKALPFLYDGDSVLEIGCGEGGFLDRVRAEKRLSVHGIDISETAVAACLQKGISASVSGIEEYARDHVGEYDVVCAFEMLEHIPNVDSFMRSAASLLKAGGTLIVSVPNNNSFIFRHNADMALNMPPHHAGLWDAYSLLSIARFFPFRVDSIVSEPLQEYHRGYLESYVFDSVGRDLKRRFRFLGRIVMRLGRSLIRKAVSAVRPEISGHTICVVYTKV